MTNYDFKLFIPKTEQLSQKPLYTPPTNVPTKQPVALIYYGIMKNKVQDDLTENELTQLMNLFEEADKEDLYGKLFSEKDEHDYLLNENEQKNLLQILKEKYPKICSVVSRFIDEIQSKSDNEKIAYNFSLSAYKYGHLCRNKQIVEYGLGYLNNENLNRVSLKYRNSNLLYDLYENAQERAEEEPPEEEDFDNYFAEGEERTEEKVKKYREEFENWKKDCKELSDSGLKDIETIKEKCIEFSNYLIKVAEKLEIYTKDYEEDLIKALNNNDVKYLVIATQRLSDRITISNGKNKAQRDIVLKERTKEPNGKIDEYFKQGYTGDCWFIEALCSMCENDEILEKINNMITVNKDGDVIKSVTVNIQGKDYTIDYENLRDANEYAWGDMDVRALEMAVNQYMHENNIENGDIALGSHEDDLPYKILFGENNIEINKFEAENYINYLKENKNVKIFSNISSIDFDDVEGERYYVMNGNGEEVELIYAHSYKYSRIDDEFYYFTNPHAPDKELHIAISDFAKMFYSACIVKFKNNEEQASL